MNLGRIDPESTALLICDMQERFRDIIHNFNNIADISKFILDISNILDIPVIVSEQYPKAFGNTINELKKKLSGNVKIFEKKRFSMINDELKNYFINMKIKSVIIVGVETHICVLQTSLDLLELGIDVHIIENGVSSQKSYHKISSINRLQQSGAFITSAESIIFQLLKTSEHEKFKIISGRIKENHV